MNLPPENPYGHTKKLRYILEHLKPLEGTYATVLDFGCGNGTAVTQYLDAMFLRVIGVEYDDASRDYARKLLPMVQFYSSLQPEFQVESFDAIICADVLEHLTCPDLALKAFRILLKPNGILLGSVPNGHGLFELENRLYKTRLGFRLSQTIEIGLNPWRLLQPKRNNVPYNNGSPHVQFFSFDDLHQLAIWTGFYGHVRAGVVLGSPPITAHILEKSQYLMELNGRLADRLPLRYVSSWLFCWRKDEQAQRD